MRLYLSREHHKIHFRKFCVAFCIERTIYGQSRHSTEAYDNND